MLIKADAIWAALLQVVGATFRFEYISFRASFPSISAISDIRYLFMAEFQSTCSTREIYIYIAREAEIKYTAAWERHLFADTNWDHLFQILRHALGLGARQNPG
jgi:hypothetical protein